MAEGFNFDYTKLVVGATFYETCTGCVMKFTVKESAVLANDGFEGRTTCRWVGVDESGNDVDFLSTAGYGHYGPKIYLEDEIVEVNGRYFTAR